MNALMKVAAIVALCMFASTCLAESKYIFAGAPWGSTEDVVKAKIVAAGFTQGQIDKQGNSQFTGEVLGKKAVVTTVMDGGKLVKVFVTLLTPDQEARTVFKEMKEQLISKYGRPTNDYAFFERPYKEGDGYEDQAIRMGKGHFVTAWQGDVDPPSTYKENLVVMITQQLAVTVGYESSAWGPIVERRKKKSTKAF